MTSPRLFKAVLTCAIAMAGLGLSTPSSLASTSTTPYNMTYMEPPVRQVDGWFGDGLANAGDLNGDGVNDMYVGETQLNVGPVTTQGRVYAVSGRDRSVIYAIDAPEPQAGKQFGFFFTVFGDVDGDGIRDIAIGTDAQDVYTGSGPPCGAPEPNGCNENQGRVWVFSGAQGKLLSTIDNPSPQGTRTNRARFGSRLGAAGDVTGDGIGDLIVGAPYNDQPAGCGDQSPLPAGCRVDEGQSFIFNGATGALVRTLNLPPEDRQPAGICTASCGWFGIAVQSPGDTDGDGVPDQLVDAGSYAVYTGTGTPCGTPEPNGCNELQGRMYLYSGRTGQLIRRIDDPFPTAGTLFGFQDVAPSTPGDVNGDGLADIFGSASEEGAGHGQGYVFDGKTGSLLYELKIPNAAKGDDMFSMDAADYNRDGTPDLFVGDLPVNTLPQDENGGAYIFDGRTGALLKSFMLSPADREPGRRVTTPPNAGPFLGWSVLAPGDLNGDGEPDFVASTPRKDDAGVLNAGRLYFMDSKASAGYRLTASDGGVFAFGDSNFFGSTGAVKLNRPVVGLASTPGDGGYWLVASDGGIFAFGDAAFRGSTGALPLNKPIVGMARTPTGDGYWLVAADGGIFAFGDARFFGSTGAIALNKPIVGMTVTPTGRGYWLAASDGGIFAFGDAKFFGSTGAVRLNSPIVGVSPTPSGKGYRLAAADGGIFSFGDASFLGSAGGLQLTSPVVGITSTLTGKGYWTSAADGGVFAYGDAKFLGSAGSSHLVLPVVGMAAA